MFNKMAGRPSTKFEVNLNKIDESLENIKVFASNFSCLFLD